MLRFYIGLILALCAASAEPLLKAAGLAALALAFMYSGVRAIEKKTED